LNIGKGDIMCLAIAGEIIEITNNRALVDVKGIRMWINIDFIDHPKIGDYVLIHGGFGIEKIDSEYKNFLDEVIDEICRE